MIAGHIYRSVLDRYVDGDLISHPLRQKTMAKVIEYACKNQLVIQANFKMIAQKERECNEKKIVPYMIGLELLYDGNNVYMSKRLMDRADYNFRKYGVMSMSEDYFMDFRDYLKGQTMDLMLYKHSPAVCYS